MLKKTSVGALILTSVLGLLLVIWPNGSLTAACSLVGIALMIGAAGLGYVWYRDSGKSRSTNDIARLVGCGVAFLLGLWILLNPAAFKGIVKALLGIALLAYGLYELYQAYKAGKNPVAMVVPGVAALLGLLILILPFTTERIACICIGVGLLYSGITGLVERLGKK